MDRELALIKTHLNKQTKQHMPHTPALPGRPLKLTTSRRESVALAPFHAKEYKRLAAPRGWKLNGHWPFHLLFLQRSHSQTDPRFPTHLRLATNPR